MATDKPLYQPWDEEAFLADTRLRAPTPQRLLEQAQKGMKKIPNIHGFYVYFVQAQKLGFVKIGRTHNLKKRILALQTACPDELKLLNAYTFENEAEMCRAENSLHRVLKKHHHRNEWYVPSPKVVLTSTNNWLMCLYGGKSCQNV